MEKKPETDRNRENLYILDNSKNKNKDNFSESTETMKVSTNSKKPYFAKNSTNSTNKKNSAKFSDLKISL